MSGYIIPMKYDYMRLSYTDPIHYALQQVGEVESIELGKVLRARYDGYLDIEYDTEQIFVQTMDKDEAIQTAMGVMDGLFPPANGSEFNWNLVPVHSISKAVDNVRHLGGTCAA